MADIIVPSSSNNQVNIIVSGSLQGRQGQQGVAGNPATNYVTSVAGKQGVITLQIADIDSLQGVLNGTLSSTEDTTITGQLTFNVTPVFNDGIIIKNTATGTYHKFYPFASDNGAWDSEVVSDIVAPPDPGSGIGYGFPFGLMFGSTIISGSGVSGGGSGGSSFPFGLSLGVSLL